MLQYSYCWREVLDAEGPLLVSNGQPTSEIKEHQDSTLDLIMVNLLRHLPGPIGVSSELMTRVRPLHAGQNPPECEVHHHNDSIHTPVIDQP